MCTRPCSRGRRVWLLYSRSSLQQYSGEARLKVSISVAESAAHAFAMQHIVNSMEPQRLHLWECKSQHGVRDARLTPAI